LPHATDPASPISLGQYRASASSGRTICGRYVDHHSPARYLAIVNEGREAAVTAAGPWRAPARYRQQWSVLAVVTDPVGPGGFAIGLMWRAPERMRWRSLAFGPSALNRGTVPIPDAVEVIGSPVLRGAEDLIRRWPAGRQIVIAATRLARGTIGSVQIRARWRRFVVSGWAADPSFAGCLG
jgi:hypothetical protein